jgi:hypothetical protein
MKKKGKKKKNVLTKTLPETARKLGPKHYQDAKLYWQVELGNIFLKR